MMVFLSDSRISGEECPSDGTAYIFGKDITSNPKAARQHVCPVILK